MITNSFHYCSLTCYIYKLQVHGKAKMKKAFCEPKNIEFCPPISVAAAFSFGLTADSVGTLEISRKEENGGNVSFTSRGELEAAFAQGEEVLHPGDLKGVVTSIMVSQLEKLAGAIKADGEASKASAALKALAKKQAKNKNKK